jgi:hypothetical protein
MRYSLMNTRCGRLLLIEINLCYSEPFCMYRMKWQDFKNLIKFPAFGVLALLNERPENCLLWSIIL